MASIQRKIIHGRPYYYLVESRRVNGRPRPVVLQYLGSADSLLQRLQHQQLTPTRARLSHFEKAPEVMSHFKYDYVRG